MCCISVLSCWSAQSASHVNQKCESCAVECDVYALVISKVIGVVVLIFFGVSSFLNFVVASVTDRALDFTWSYNPLPSCGATFCNTEFNAGFAVSLNVSSCLFF